VNPTPENISICYCHIIIHTVYVKLLQKKTNLHKSCTYKLILSVTECCSIVEGKL